MAERQDPSKFLSPPVWNPGKTSYEDWKFEITLWQKFTKIEKKRQGFAIYSCLPNENEIQDKVRLAIQNDEIQIETDAAVEQIFQVLDKSYKKDDLSTVYETWKDFKNYEKKEEETMETFISNYDKKVKELKKQSIELPKVVLAMQLLDSANLGQKEKQIVLTGVNYNDKELMYDQTKSALRKYLGQQTLSQEQKSRISIKSEPVFNSQIEEETFLARRGDFRGSRGGYRGRRGGWSNPMSRRGSENRGRGNNFRGRVREFQGPRKNARDESGKHMKCAVCESIMHFKRDCPHNQEAYVSTESMNNDDRNNNDVQDVWKIEYSQEDKHIFMTETVHAAVLDSACSKTVAGQAWKEMYMSSLPEEEKRKVKVYPSRTTFKFGSGDKLVSNECIEIPCLIGGRHSSIKTEVVESDIPLLLSKPDMKRLGFKINMVNDTLEVNGRSIDLDTTSSGHYYIPLKECEMNIESVHLVTELQTVKEKSQMIKKLHRQFGHPSAISLKAIMKSADVIDKDCEKIIEDTSKNCDICLRFKKTPPRPAVSLPMSSQFNGTVAMDLKTFGNVYFIHFIDLYTRFSKSKVIRRKLPKVIVDSVATEWIAAGFGPPKKFLIDNGGEFDNEEYRELSEQFNVEICPTAAYSPWSNGICERNHYVIDVCVQKMLEEDPKMEIDVALAWAVNAKNSMQNHLGFSPIQLVLGSNPNLPCVLTDDLPAHEDVSMSETVLKHLNALHSARRAFTKAESSDRIKRALRHNVRACEETFFPGDRVFYKRDDNNRWRGPGKVIGQDGKVLFIKHGSQLVRVATCRAIKTESSKSVNEESRQFVNPGNTQDKRVNNIPVAGNVSGENETIQSKESEFQQDIDVLLEIPIPENSADVQDNSEISCTQENITPKKESHSETPASENILQNPGDRKRLPCSQEIIRFRSKDDEEWSYVKVLGKGGKSTGKNKSYMNVIDEKNNHRFGIHLDKYNYEIIGNLQDSEQNEDNHQSNRNEEEVNILYVPAGDHCKPEVIEAKDKELENWKTFNVYKEVEDKGQKTISTRWVITEKTIDRNKVVKARLVVRGFEEEDKVQSDSPTAAKSTLRLVMALAANEQWKLETIDIKAAFLQGKELDRDIFVTPPKDIREEGIIWKLNKVVYGLEDASRNWFFSVEEDLISLECKQSELDKALFRWYKGKQLAGLFVMHVDDFLFGGSEEFNSCVVDQIAKKYRVGKRTDTIFKYVGLNIKQNKNGSIDVNQNEYATELEEVPLSKNRKGDRKSPLNSSETKALKSVAGQLNWLATQTRPDISFQALELNMSKQHPTVENLMNANKAIRQAKQRSVNIHFPKIGKQDGLKLKVFCDASWGNLPDGISSAQGNIIFLTDEDEQNCCPLSWSSNKIKRKVASTLAAEAFSLHDTLDEAIYLNAVLSETLFDCKSAKLKISAATDNDSLHKNIHSTKQVHEKRLRI